ncbi:hypothetical protein BU17DRAFT_97493 [Hysterangium stoloniferum]|nr:hypothetical protein BU17DRAFT_97493 [Hysterangium stoloniferum]
MSRINMTTTLIPNFPNFPVMLPTPPQPHHTPLAPLGKGPRRISDRRDLVQEIDDLSEEEGELEDMRNEIKSRGATWLIPIGKQQTLAEEKNDQTSHSGSEGGSVSGGPPSNADDAENESAPDLDASMIDMDDAEVEEDEGNTGATDEQDLSMGDP